MDFKREDFTEDEYKILLLMLRTIDVIIETDREGNSDVYGINTLYRLTQKLGLEDIYISEV